MEKMPHHNSLAPENRIRVTNDQIEMLVKFFEKKPYLLDLGGLGSTKEKRKSCEVAWEELKDLLNKDGHGPIKTTEKWKKTVTDLKHKTRGKISKMIEDNLMGDSKLPHQVLTPLEMRFASVMGYSFLDENDAATEFPVAEDSSEVTEGEISDSTKRKLEDEDSTSIHENGLDSMRDETLLKDLIKMKNKKQKTTTERPIIVNASSHAPVEINPVDDPDFQARIIQAEELKADALQRIASSFENIASTFQTFCQVFLSRNEMQNDE